ncbi:MAG: hypothetical protein AAF620_15280 [Bacteroidota bacterium]
MELKYYFISYRVDMGSSTPYFGEELTEMSPVEYSAYWKELNQENPRPSGLVDKRIILFSQEVSEAEYKQYKGIINDIP